MMRDGHPTNSHPPVGITVILEFACWVIVGLVPLLRLVNGPAVTVDQFVIQVTIATMAFVGALALRYYNWRSSP